MASKLYTVRHTTTAGKTVRGAGTFLKHQLGAWNGVGNIIDKMKEYLSQKRPETWFTIETEGNAFVVTVYQARHQLSQAVHSKLWRAVYAAFADYLEKEQENVHDSASDTR